VTTTGNLEGPLVSTSMEEDIVMLGVVRGKVEEDLIADKLFGELL
jgi:hypothetical protein